MAKARPIGLKVRVKNYRWDRRFAQSQMAKDLDIPRSVLSYIENGHHQPNVHLALRIAKYFNTRVENLFELQE